MKKISLKGIKTVYEALTTAEINDFIMRKMEKVIESYETTKYDADFCMEILCKITNNNKVVTDIMHGRIKIEPDMLSTYDLLSTVHTHIFNLYQNLKYTYYPILRVNLYGLEDNCLENYNIETPSAHGNFTTVTNKYKDNLFDIQDIVLYGLSRQIIGLYRFLSDSSDKISIPDKIAVIYIMLMYIKALDDIEGR